MIIDKPQCSLDACRYCFDGNCINEKRYKTCEFTYFKELEADCMLVEQRYGQWILADSDVDWYLLECSVCKHQVTTYDGSNLVKYCPNCGVKMR